MNIYGKMKRVAPGRKSYHKARHQRALDRWAKEHFWHYFVTTMADRAGIGVDDMKDI